LGNGVDFSFFGCARRQAGLHVVYEYQFKGDDTRGSLGADIYEQEIYGKIGDIGVSMKTEDYPYRSRLSAPDGRYRAARECLGSLSEV
jgi:hypothetical protein